MSICNTLRDLVPFVRFKKRENIHGVVLLLVLLKVALLHRCFLRFLNSTNGAKSRKAFRKCQCCPHIETSQLICTANQLTGFYTRATITLNGLRGRRRIVLPILTFS